MKRERDVSASTLSSVSTDDGVDPETSLSLSLLRLYTFFSRSQSVIIIIILFENACELQRVVFHLVEISILLKRNPKDHFLV